MMYRGKVNTSNIENQVQGSRASNMSRFESQGQTLQKEVQKYTRKLEEEKKRLFRVQENHRQATKEHQYQVEGLKQCKSKKNKSEISALSAKLKLLENSFQKGISAYNQALSQNNSLKVEIDQLRKQRKNQSQSFIFLNKKIEEMNTMMNQLDQNIDMKKSKVNKHKNDILELKNQNQNQHTLCQSNLQQMTQSLNIKRNIQDTLQNPSKKKSTETSDIQPIMKQRLKNLIHKNKEKVKIIEQYRKNMQKIQKSFQQIKQDSGINDIQDITDKFLKQEVQSTIIFEYINKLASQLECVRDQNDKMKLKIEKQEQKNSQYRQSLSGTPQQQRAEMQIRRFLDEKNQPINKTTQFMKKIQTKLFQILGVQHEVLSAFNIEQYLAKLEELINCSQEGIKWSDTQNNKPKEDITKYSRALPVFASDELKDRGQQIILGQDKFRDYAAQFWDKKKNNK